MPTLTWKKGVLNQKSCNETSGRVVHVFFLSLYPFKHYYTENLTGLILHLKKKKKKAEINITVTSLPVLTAHLL